MADTEDLQHEIAQHAPDLMNDPAYDVNTSTGSDDEDTSQADGEREDTCRICRSEGTEEEPLFYPCKCSGSIKFVHQDCLMEWLSHTNKKHCELCKTPFRFTKLYDSQMPETLPFDVFLQRAGMDILGHVMLWFRGMLVGFVWLILLPWSIRWTWRLLFFMLDAGWAREPWIAKMEAESLQNDSSLAAMPTFVAQTVKSVLNTTTTAEVQSGPEGALTYQFGKLLWNLILGPWRTSSSMRQVNSLQGNLTHLAAKSTVLSDYDFATNLTSSPYFNKLVVDVLEGQMITFLVIVAFILVFLIREWVIQQQPILNAAAQVRNELDNDAEQRVERDENVEHIDRAERAGEARRHVAANVANHGAEVDHAAERDVEDVATDSHAESSNSSQGNDVFSHTDPATDAQSSKDDSHFDWVSFDRRVQAACSIPPLSDPAHQDPNDSTIRSLTDQLQEIVQEALTQPDPDYRAMTKLLDWARAVPSDVDPRWRAHLLAALGDLRPEDMAQRPAMPPRGATTHVNEVLRALEEIETDDQDDFMPFHSMQPSADSGIDRDDHRWSSSTESSWQRVADEDAPNHGTAHSLPEAHDSTNDRDVERDQSPMPDEVSQHADLESDDPNSTHSERQPSGPVGGNVVEQHRGPLRRLSDWFWGDIELNGTGDDPMPAQDDQQVVEDIAAEAPFVPRHGDHRIENEFIEFPLGPDPEVAAAAAEAGLDAEAIEEAEDLEGIMELIGMQGPIIGLVQTAMFCGVLVTVTLWGAIGVPYLFGKLALLFIGDPVLFLVVLPLQIVANLGDVLIDLGLLLVGSVAYWAVEGIRLLTSLLAYGVPFINTQYLQTTSSYAHSTFYGAANHLGNMFVAEETHETLESGFLLVSIQAHKSLQDLKHEIAVVSRTMLTAVVFAWDFCRNLSISRTIDVFGRTAPAMVHWKSLASTWLQDSFAGLIGDNGLTLTIRAARKITIEPIEAYWSGGDRTLTVLLGYSFLATIGAAFLLRKEPLFTSSTLQKIEKSFTDILKQAGGVLKVILIISIEMLAFPLYCGLLLDCALLPLFQGATFTSRLEFASRSPCMFTFLHWFLGTAYMFNFALFVSMCRRILRSGVLYFIRDPDDPTFHPVRDVLERSVSTQLRKIAFSALVYGLLVILCLGGVIWGIAHTTTNVFPVRWSTPEPVLEFPLEFLFYNFMSPFLFKFIKPSSGLEAVYQWWLRVSARQLRLSHFLFGERRRDEEGRYIGHDWKQYLFFKAEDTTSRVVDVTEDRSLTSSPVDKGLYTKDGTYVRAPASDQVRIIRGQTVFLEVAEEDVNKTESEQDCTLHGRPNQKFRNVYVPPWFRLRIGLFLASLWLLSAAIGAGFTLLPLLFGRGLCWLMLPTGVRVNDIWSFAVGLHLELGIAYCAMTGPGMLEKAKEKLSRIDIGPIVQKLKHFVICAAKSTYVYGFGIVVVPTTSAIIFQLYLTLPLRTYVESMAPSSSTTDGIPFLSPSNVANTTGFNVTQSTQDESWMGMHSIYILPDWTLGFLYGRLMIHLMSLSQNSLPAAAFRQITRNGYFNPDIRLATRAFVLPTLLFSSTVLLGPMLFAGSINTIILSPMTKGLSEISRTRMYRYSYPMCASQALLLWCGYETIKATRRWRSKIRDEVYLIGERLHNFGEKRPPPGSKTVARKDRA